MVANALPVVLGSGVYGQTGLTSAGTTQADAYQIIAQVNEFTTVGASSGAVLPVGNYHITVINLGANTLKLYPSVGDLIDNGSANSSINIPVNSSWTGTCSLPATVAPPRRWTTNGTNPVTITNPAITGGTIDNAVIGGSTPAAGTFTSLGAADITGTDASLDIGGLAGVTTVAGGAIVVRTGAGGTSGLSGALTLATGVGGTTSASGTITIQSGAPTAGAGAASGALAVQSAAGATGTTSTAGGASGAVTLQSSAGGTSGTSTGGAGGAVTVATGAGGAVVTSTGTGGAGGALAITAGAGGGTNAVTGGAGGSVTLTAGAGGTGSTTGGAAGTVTVTAGAGGSGSAVVGGNINLIPGAASSTALPGELLVNSVAGLMEVGFYQPLSTTAIPASASVVTFFMANRAYRIKAISVIEATFGTSETFTFHKNTGTTAPGGGTAILTGAIATAVSNTRVVGTLSSTIATLTLAAGDRVSFTVGGTVGSGAGLNVSMLLVPV